MKLKYKFKGKDLLDSCKYVTYGKRIEDIIGRVREHLVDVEGYSIERANSKEVEEKIRSLIRESRYVIVNKLEGGQEKCLL